jgi:hypothetical protein
MIGFGQEEYPKKGIAYVEGERAPTSKELELWQRAKKAARRVNLLSYAMKMRFKNVLLVHAFAQERKITLNEPTLPDLEMRMNKALSEIERLKDDMCGVSQLELGVQLSSGGNDLDIVQPESSTMSLGWILPAIVGGVIVIGIIARWAYLESEVSEISAQYNGVLKRSDMALCENPDSEQCKAWEHAKQTGGYYKRESLIESVKSAVSTAGVAAKKGLSAGLALAIPLLLYMYMPRGGRKG